MQRPCPGSFSQQRLNKLVGVLKLRDSIDWIDTCYPRDKGLPCERNGDSRPKAASLTLNETILGLVQALLYLTFKIPF